MGLFDLVVMQLKRVVLVEVEPPSVLRYLIGVAIMMLGVVFPVGCMIFRSKRVPSSSSYSKQTQLCLSRIIIYKKIKISFSEPNARVIYLMQSALVSNIGFLLFLWDQILKIGWLMFCQIYAVMYTYEIFFEYEHLHTCWLC